MHGLRGTGSKRVVADAVFVPAHRTIASLSGIDPRLEARTRDRPGRAVHSNPMYRAGGIFSVLFGEAVAVAIGIARATLDVYEETVRSRATMTPPIVPMKEHPRIQRCFGEAVQQIDVAEHGLLGSDRDYMEWCERDGAGAAPFSAEREQRLILRKLLCARLCASAVDLMVRTGGTSGMRRGSPIERLQRDMTTLMTHPTVQLETCAETYALLRFATPTRDGTTADLP